MRGTSEPQNFRATDRVLSNLSHRTPPPLFSLPFQNSPYLKGAEKKTEVASVELKRKKGGQEGVGGQERRKPYGQPNPKLFALWPFLLSAIGSEKKHIKKYPHEE